MLNRRHFLTLATAMTALPSLAIAQDHGMIDYTPGMVADRLAEGETVLVDFAADWCSTCRRQERVMLQLRGENPAYDEMISFIRVDWDAHQYSFITQDLGVPRRSTLVLLRGEEELGRLVADTRVDAIRDLLDLGLTGS